MNQQISVGIAGLGRSGWDIHAKAFGAMPEHYRVVAVSDFDETRREEAAARFDCRTYENFSDLIAEADIELIVVATPNRFHAAHAIEALRAGKNVVCEKPFGVDSREAAAMIAAAKESERTLAPFQNRRYEAVYQKVKEVVQSGVLGEIQFIRQGWHGFGRRWDWQTLTKMDGGQLLNNGTHALDQMLDLIGERPYEIFADLRNVLSSGDAEDFIKIVLMPQPETGGQRGPIVELEMSSCSAFPQDRWLIMGDAGTLRADLKSVEWKWIDWSGTEAHAVEAQAAAGRSYNREDLPWQSELWNEPQQETPLEQIFYQGLLATLREDKPLFISPQSVQRVMQLIEQAKANTQVQQGRFAIDLLHKS